MMRSWWTLMLCLLLMVPLAGCWDLHELNEVGIVTGMAIDRGEKYRYKLSVEGLNVTELGGKRATGNTPVIVYGEEGDDLSELTRKMSTGLSRKLIYSHMRVLAIADSLAKEGLLEFLDFMERDHEIRDDFNVLIVKGARADQVISTTYPRQKVPSLKVHNQIDAISQEWGGDPIVRLKDIVSALTSPGRQPVAEVVSVQGDQTQGEDSDNNKKLKPASIVKIEGMAVFRNQKMIGTLPMNDVRNYVWTQNKLRNTTISVPCGEEQYFNLRVYNSVSDVTMTYANQRPQIKLQVELESFLNGTQCAMDLEKSQTFEQLEQTANAWLAKSIRNTIQRVQKQYGVDIFGFGEEMYRQEADVFKKVEKQWDEEFKKAEITVECDLRIRRSGIRTKSLLQNLK